MTLQDSSFRHRLDSAPLNSPRSLRLEVVRGELFAFQVLILGDAPFQCTLDQSRQIDWRGLTERVRIEVAGADGLLAASFLGYVARDDGVLVADPILQDRSQWIADGWRAIWVEGRIPADSEARTLRAVVTSYGANGYEPERLLGALVVDIDVLPHVMRPVAEGDFKLDLWQHPSSWARPYGLEPWSDQHFAVIDTMLGELASLGQRVVSLVVTDFPWAGQRCYQVVENPSNLFEYNIVGVRRNVAGELACDFSALDRYVQLCFRHGIDEEIDLFGLVGNWDAISFGNPLDDYRDPLRVACFDEATRSWGFLHTREELREYVTRLFEHLVAAGLWDRVRVTSDEPGNVELFQEAEQFLVSCAGDLPLRLKCAVHDQEFLREYGTRVHDISLNTCDLVQDLEGAEQLRADMRARGGDMDWYSCCFPIALNIFLESPLVESRLIGWFTRFWGLSGFLRWAFAIWTSDPLADVRYKFPKWHAGDMLFVYPGADMRPLPSIRERNLLFGIQDFNLLADVERAGAGSVEIERALGGLLGSKKDMRRLPERQVALDFETDITTYLTLRNDLVKRYLISADKRLEMIAASIVSMREDEIGGYIQAALDEPSIAMQDIFIDGLQEGMRRAIERYDRKEYDIPELIVCADTLHRGLRVLSDTGVQRVGSRERVVLAVVEGDVHEVGKNIVRIMLESAGFDVIDLGVNRTAAEILEAAKSHGADVIGMSSMMTTTRDHMSELISQLDNSTDGSRPLVVVGGGSITPSYADEIGADGYAPSAPETIRLLSRLLQERAQ